MPGRTASGCGFPKPCHGPVDRNECPIGPPGQAALCIRLTKLLWHPATLPSWPGPIPRPPRAT